MIALLKKNDCGTYLRQKLKQYALKNPASQPAEFQRLLLSVLITFTIVSSIKVR